MYVFYVKGFHSTTPGLSLFMGKVLFLKVKANQHAGLNSDLMNRSGKGNINAVEDVSQTHTKAHTVAFYILTKLYLGLRCSLCSTQRRGNLAPIATIVCASMITQALTMCVLNFTHKLC